MTLTEGSTLTFYIRTIATPLICVLLLGSATPSSGATPAPAAANDSPPSLPNLLETLVVDSLRPLGPEQEQAEKLALVRLMDSEDGRSDDDQSGDGPDLQKSPDAPGSQVLDGQVTESATEDEIGSMVQTASGQVRLCFRGDSPQVVRQEALAAATRWDEVLQINGPVVEIDFYWLDLGRSNVLGAAGPTRFVLNPGLPEPGARYPVALANELLGVDQMPREVCGSVKQGEIVLLLNADAGSNAGGWVAGDEMLDPDLDSSQATDLQTTLLHELGHGFGFIGSAELDEAGELAWPNDHPTPLIFDLYTRSCNHETYQGCATTNSITVDVGDLPALTSGKLWISTGLGPLLELEAPFAWDTGSSFSHLDEYRYPAQSPFSLMTPYIDTEQRVRSVDNATLAIMQRMGWTIIGTVAPITSMTSRAGPNEVSLQLSSTDLDSGIPPVSYEMRVSRIEANATGELSQVHLHEGLKEQSSSATVGGLQNRVLYQIEVTSSGAVEKGRGALSGPILPLGESNAEQFVEEVYDVLLGRGPATDERARFLFLASSEAGSLGMAMAEVFASREAFEQQIVARLYLGFLERSPDIGGLHYWVDRLEAGSSVVDLAEDFVNATAFETGLIEKNEDFVRQIYISVLKREPDPEGLTYWTGLLDQGVTRGRILVEISESKEHRMKVPVLPEMLIAYLRWENRLPSTDELDLWFDPVDREGMGQLLTALLVDAVPLVELANAPTH